ncbi:hypothetical protein PTKIN_Ptkin16aG0064500 [Pterospermum kingtungense]
MWGPKWSFSHDQLKVICNPSIGGFWTHCGWNSILEAVFVGVPMLTFPLLLDQDTNHRQIMEDWRNGWRVNTTAKAENFFTKESSNDICLLYQESSHRTSLFVYLPGGF